MKFADALDLPHGTHVVVLTRSGETYSGNIAFVENRNGFRLDNVYPRYFAESHRWFSGSDVSDVRQTRAT